MYAYRTAIPHPRLEGLVVGAGLNVDGGAGGGSVQGGLFSREACSHIEAGGRKNTSEDVKTYNNYI